MQTFFFWAYFLSNESLSGMVAALFLKKALLRHFMGKRMSGTLKTRTQHPAGSINKYGKYRAVECEGAESHCLWLSLL